MRLTSMSGRSVALGAALAVVVSCATSDRVTGLKAGSAQFSLSANIFPSSRATQLFVGAIYTRHGKTVNAVTGIDSLGESDWDIIDAKIVDLNTIAGAQTVPFAVDLTKCIADPDATRSGVGCDVGVVSFLLTGHTVLPPDPREVDLDSVELAEDFVMVNNATPGAKITVPRPLDLHELDHIVVQSPSFSLAVGATAKIQASGVDAQGTKVSLGEFNLFSLNPSVVALAPNPAGTNCNNGSPGGTGNTGNNGNNCVLPDVLMAFNAGTTTVNVTAHVRSPAPATVQVFVPVPFILSSINDTTGTPQNLQNVTGTIVLNANVTLGNSTATSIDVIINNVGCASLTIPPGPAGGTFKVNCNTAQRDATGARRFPPGTATMITRLNYRTPGFTGIPQTALATTNITLR